MLHGNGYQQNLCLTGVMKLLLETITVTHEKCVLVITGGYQKKKKKYTLRLDLFKIMVYKS